MVYGFDLGEAVAVDLLLSDYNPRCSLPWSEKDLRHKIPDANSKPFDKLRGWLLNSAPGMESVGRRTTPCKTSQAMTINSPDALFRVGYTSSALWPGTRPRDLRSAGVRATATSQKHPSKMASISDDPNG